MELKNDSVKPIEGNKRGKGNQDQRQQWKTHYVVLNYSQPLLKVIFVDL